MRFIEEYQYARTCLSLNWRVLRGEYASSSSSLFLFHLHLSVAFIHLVLLAHALFLLLLSFFFSAFLLLPFLVFFYRLAPTLIVLRQGRRVLVPSARSSLLGPGQRTLVRALSHVTSTTAMTCRLIIAVAVHRTTYNRRQLHQNYSSFADSPSTTIAPLCSLDPAPSALAVCATPEVLDARIATPQQ